ncbi:MAG: lysophospholipid acyltransferase family protein [Bacteroidia bacterium]|nr:lysophospholipid acyltransferase family protein [Bacteroidia bacterium]
MPELVSRQDFARAIQLQRYHMGAAAGPLMRLTGLTEINEIYAKLQPYQGLDFIDKLFELLEVELIVEGRDLSQLPSGGFVVISNHPFGTLDGLALVKVFGAQRPDFKIMANFLLQNILTIKDFFVAVNPLESHPGAYSNLLGMKQALKHVTSGHCLGIFPAGEVSTFQPKHRAILDRPWQKSAIKLIQRAGVPVVPVYFEGANSALFHLMGLIHPALRTAAIPSEMLKKKHTRIRMRIGSPISSREIQAISGADRLGRYLRARAYSLDADLGRAPFFRQRFQIQWPQRAIAQPGDPALIRNEVAQLAPDRLICRQAEFDVYCASAQEIPSVLQEIGRLREITFRGVGEGTGLTRDLDEYDLIYLHLFIWDREQQTLVGAYRMGKGDEIMATHGVRGFYTHTVFKIHEGFNPILSQSIELGRSFVLASYQKKRLPLFLLWKGIHTYLQHHPQYRYLIGPVSISNDYATLSKEVIVALIRRYYFDENLAKLVQPRKRFRPQIKKVDVEDLLEGVTNDLKQMDRLIEEIEPAHFRLPILLKKYIKQNARIICFNVDPKFNNCLDGFMVLDLKDLPPETVESMGE